MAKTSEKVERVTTGVPGLDEMLDGGFLAGTCVLVRGAPGTGKTSLGLQFLLEGARQGEQGLLISFEEFPQSLHRDAASLGWDLHQLQDAGLLHMIFTSPAVFLSELGTPSSKISQMFQGNIGRVVLDSVTHFTRVANTPVELRDVYNAVVNGLKREGATSLLLGEESRISCAQVEKGSLSFIADGILLLRYVEVESAVQRALAVLKMRGTSHAKEIRRYEIRPNGLVITGVFEGREGLLSGVSHRAAV